LPRVSTTPYGEVCKVKSAFAISQGKYQVIRMVDARKPIFDKYRNAAFFIGFIILAILARLPFIDIVNDDEAFYSVLAQRWLHSDWPYSKTFDVKPPMIFAVLAAFQSVFGMQFLTIKIIEMLSVGVSAYGVWRILELFDQKKAAVWAAILTVGFSLSLLGVYFPVQLLQMMFTVLAILSCCKYIISGKVIHNYIGGFLIGLCILTKQTAVFEGIAFLIWMLIENRRGKFFETIILYGFGALCPIFLCGLAFTMAGYGQDLWQSTVLMAVARAEINSNNVEPIGPFGIVTRLTGFVASLASILALVILGVLAITRRAVLVKDTDARLLRLIPIWIFLTSLGILSVLLIQNWYAFPLIAPLVLLSGLVIERCLNIEVHGGFIKKTAVVSFIIGTALFVDRESLQTDGLGAAPDALAAQKATKQLIEFGMRKGDSILVPIRGNGIYVLSGNYPDTKYVHAFHLICKFSTPDPDPLGQALNSRPKYIVLSDTNSYYGCTSQSKIDRLLNALENNYQKLGSVHGTWDTMELYKRKEKTN